MTHDPLPTSAAGLPCPHGRSHWSICPHCNGLNTSADSRRLPTDQSATAEAAAHNESLSEGASSPRTPSTSAAAQQPRDPLLNEDGKHECPKVGCTERLPRHILACRPHWFSVSEPTRRRVNATWRSGDLSAYLAAREDAVDEMNRAS